MIMGLANALLPVVVDSVAGAMVYAVVVMACTGCLVALVIPLAAATLKPPPGRKGHEVSRPTAALGSE